MAIGLQAALPAGYAPSPRWLIPALETAVAIVVFIGDTAGTSRFDRPLRRLSLAVIGLLTTANAVAGVSLVNDVVHGNAITVEQLLLSGMSIWLINVIAFSLWYWEFDRGGPKARAAGTADFPDLAFVQIQTPELAPPDWEPRYVDYLYLSFTNSTAYSPTDVLPMTRWTKAAMGLQSAVSFLVVAMVFARAVNIL